MNEGLTKESFVKMINKTELNQDEILKFTSEDQFISFVFGLLKEAASITSVLSNAQNMDENGTPLKWSRNEAIIGGLLVRIVKLQKGILEQTMNNQREFASIFIRCLAETVINFKYLLHNFRDTDFDSYIEYSLRTEKRLLIEVEARLEVDEKESALKAGLNQRMKSSILQAFEKSGMTPEQVNERLYTPWAGKNLRDKAKEISYENGYLALFSLPSHTVHGNWQDLLEFHLTAVETGFEPRSDWAKPRPQYLSIASKMSVDACESFLDRLPKTPLTEAMEEMLSDLQGRLGQLDFLHEEFLQKSG